MKMSYNVQTRAPFRAFEIRILQFMVLAYNFFDRVAM
jgi:hypothetical protein